MTQGYQARLSDKHKSQRTGESAASSAAAVCLQCREAPAAEHGIQGGNCRALNMPLSKVVTGRNHWPAPQANFSFPPQHRLIACRSHSGWDLGMPVPCNRSSKRNNASKRHGLFLKHLA